MLTPARQWIRSCTVIVGRGLTSNLNQGLRIQGPRVTFQVEKTLRGPPNTANIKIYNLNQFNDGRIREEFDDVILDCGYVGSSRVIFRGGIKYPFKHRETTDWITEIQAADGDKDYSDALVNATLAPGRSAEDAVDEILRTMPNTRRGTIQLNPYRFLRGRTLVGSARQLLDTIARDHGASWSIQDGSLDIIKADSVLPLEVVVVNSKTGMIGAPEVSGKGILVKTLLNPQIRVNGRIKLDNSNIKVKTIQQYTTGPKVRDRTLARLDPDGVYKVYKLRHIGDTRGNDWVTEAECIALGSPTPRSGGR